MGAYGTRFGFGWVQGVGFRVWAPGCADGCGSWGLSPRRALSLYLSLFLSLSLSPSLSHSLSLSLSLSRSIFLFAGGVGSVQGTKEHNRLPPRCVDARTVTPPPLPAKMDRDSARRHSPHGATSPAEYPLPLTEARRLKPQTGRFQRMQTAACTTTPARSPAPIHPRYKFHLF